MRKAKHVSDEELWRTARAVTTLKDAHDALVKVMPAPDAEPAAKRDFYLRSAEVYGRVAEIDRGHHHEALYWATREREKGEEIARALASGSAGDDGSGR
ncbi:AMED_5909 family protein [Saccharothrix deserti]|uniref:AMED_5909 family protein n=1 Tax=Saccharothrix deserti TaxID=2593674 RepID=UPI00131ABE96|nr:AMED_5909 family protein [Saccharothrix deserti]